MKSTTKLGYVCAGVGLGGALGVLLAPKPGPETRDDLREIAERGRDLLIGQARDVRDLFERRNDFLEAGKEHFSQSLEAGREAYRETAAEIVPTPKSSLAAVGLLLFEAAALTASYKLAAGAHKSVRGVGPQLGALLETSRTAVLDGARQIGVITSRVHRILSAVENMVKNEPADAV